MKNKRAHTVTFKERLTSQLIQMRHLAKNSSGGHAKTFWVGFDQACFEIQKRFDLLDTQSIKGE